MVCSNTQLNGCSCFHINSDSRYWNNVEQTFTVVPLIPEPLYAEWSCLAFLWPGYVRGGN